MTRLLVSARNLAEARLALECGVDLIDLKEPTRGALGPVDADEAARVVDFIAGRVPVSVALGELADFIDGSNSNVGLAPSLAVSRRVEFAKLGLARCASRPDWPSEWRRWTESLPTATSPVAVIYADGAAVDAPPAEAILEVAGAAKCRAVLVDTAIKDGRTLLDHWSLSKLRQFTARLRAIGAMSVVGGSLNIDTIPQVAACGVDYIAVRGAVCEGPRTGTLCPMKLAALRKLLRVD